MSTTDNRQQPAEQIHCHIYTNYEITKTANFFCNFYFNTILENVLPLQRSFFFSEILMDTNSEILHHFEIYPLNVATANRHYFFMSRILLSVYMYLKNRFQISFVQELRMIPNLIGHKISSLHWYLQGFSLTDNGNFKLANILTSYWQLHCVVPYFSFQKSE